MADNNKETETEFEDSFDSNDDFKFLEEGEIKPESTTDASTTSPTNTGKPSGFPTKPIAIVSVIVCIGIFIFHTIHKKTEPELVPIASKEQTAKNVVATQVQPQPTKPVSTPAGREKSREEMADLFASNEAEQATNLEAALEEQSKGKDSSGNMDLYFGNNASHVKIDKQTTSKAQEILKQTAQLQQVVDSMTQEMTANVNQLKQLEAQITELSNTIEKVNQNIGNMDSRMLGLTEAVDSVTQDMSNVKKVIADEDLDLTLTSGKKETKAQLTYKSPEYSIHAIIPGRAWLKSSSGQIVTIAEGDVLGDYGTIAVIDAANNIIKTSSGVSFR